MDEKVYLTALNKCFFGSWNIAHKLLQYFGSAKAVFSAGYKELSHLLPGLDATIMHLTSDELADKAFDELELCRREGLQAISILDDGYPSRLAQTPEAPLVIFSRGSRKLDGGRFLSIVGTRHCTPMSGKYCDMVAEYLSSLKVKPVIVSGMAYGIDTLAHKSALRYGLDTIAVIATGLDTVYPACNRNLAPRIEERGAVVTEFWSQTPPFPSNFVSRNRIVAGLSDGTLVVESRLHGGSLITAKAAFNYDREVFAFPGKVEDECYAGCNELIASDIAHLARGAEDICRELDWASEGRRRTGRIQSLWNALPPEKRAVLQVLRRGGEMDAAQIAACCSRSISQISYLLLEMEIEGLVRHISANKYVNL
ncbi:MAG: DNA-processing protein DprA [Bacteroidales bacterium]|nr:DNA-processing protein DprA [Bacteroidales bacterium]